MTFKRLALACVLSCGAWTGTCLQGQQCSPLSGTTQDQTRAFIEGASIVIDGLRSVTSGKDGVFSFPCVANGSHILDISSAGFATKHISLMIPYKGRLEFTLVPFVAQNMEVNDQGSIGTVKSLSGDELQVLADDPDDLERELQQMANANGGSSQSAVISVDGFQGDSRLPPKSSIASIRINPDPFSAEYREPPFQGGRVEVSIKPGRSAFHGALFVTDSQPWMNARDPFSVSRAAIGKQRYGFELSGPLLSKKNGFSLSLERRDINNFAVVDAVTLGPTYLPMETIQDVPAPQNLWLGSIRLDLQTSSKNTLFIGYTPYQNSLQNVGVGGISLAETGYNSSVYTHTVRVGDTWTLSPHIIHEARASFDWRGENDTSLSSAPQVQVAGSFISGGSNLGDQQIKEFRTEVDEDIIVALHSHNIKAGYQMFTYDEKRQLPTDFNGTYVFGGGTAPVLNAQDNSTGAQAVISGFEQYRRTMLQLPGGTPTQYSDVSGQPSVLFDQLRLGLFVQDEWSICANLKAALGFRYFMQTDPTVLNGAAPRVGIAWSPDRKKSWLLKAHAGLFSGQYTASDYAELRREDGQQRVTSLVYSPTYGRPLINATSIIQSNRSLAPGFQNTTYSVVQFDVTRSIGERTSITASLAGLRLWDVARSVNVNSPLTGDPLGLRPGPVNLNVLQLQNSGIGSGDLETVALVQRVPKWLTLSVNAIRFNLRSTADGSIFSNPQSSRTDAGEFARLTNNPLWTVEGTALVKLPQKLQFSSIFSGAGNLPYNIITGYDNNGDGDFNDRPQLAFSNEPGAVATSYGNLVPTAGFSPLRRNIASLPWGIYLDTNLQRSFSLTRAVKPLHPQTLTINVRSSNVLNHLNVTQEGNVLGSPLFGMPYAADNGRRVEYGVRYSF